MEGSIMRLLLILLTVCLISACSMFSSEESPVSAAFLYEHKNTNEMIYCTERQGLNLLNYIPAGVAIVPKYKIKVCELERF